jgi:hypothetical protein
MAKMGRPSDYSNAVADLICEKTATSSKGMVTICGELNLSLTTVCRWLDAHDYFRQSYARAKEQQADFLADEIIAISDDASNDVIIGENGIQQNSEFIQRSRLRVDARKWVAAKLKPKKYGDKVDVTSDGQSIAPINVIAVSVQSAKEIDKLN